MIAINSFNVSDMSDLVQYILDEIVEIVSELVFSWENCEENVEICASGKSFIQISLCCFLMKNRGITTLRFIKLFRCQY